MTSRDKILSLFRSNPDAFISGQEISRTLNVSRAAVWKQVELLRENGLERGVDLDHPEFKAVSKLVKEMAPPDRPPRRH